MRPRESDGATAIYLGDFPVFFGRCLRCEWGAELRAVWLVCAEVVSIRLCAACRAMAPPEPKLGVAKRGRG